MTTRIAVLILLSLMMTTSLFPCTNFLFTRGATTDGSTFITYSADSHVLYGELYHWPAAKYHKGTMLDVYEWDTGTCRGQIPRAEKLIGILITDRNFDFSRDQKNRGHHPLSSSHFPFSERHAISGIIIASDLSKN